MTEIIWYWLKLTFETETDISNHIQAIIINEVTVIETQYGELSSTCVDEFHECFSVKSIVWATPWKVKWL